MLRKVGKKIFSALTIMAVVILSSSVVFAADAIPAGESYTKAIFVLGAMIAAGFCMGIGASGVGVGLGNAANAACSAVGRNPGVQGKILMTMLVGMAMAESIAIYCLVVALILLYANPFLKYFFVG